MILEPCPWMPDTLQAVPAPSQPAELLVLLHGWGARAQDMAMLAQALASARPQTLVLAPDGFEPAASGPGMRQWFDVTGLTPTNRAQRLAHVLPRLRKWLHEAQQHTGVPRDRTVLAGFSQGASVALELAMAHDGCVARVLALAGRCTTPPRHAPRHTALHFLQGAVDPLIPAVQTQATVKWLQALGGEATLDLAPGLGHGVDMNLLDLARRRLS